VSAGCQRITPPPEKTPPAVVVWKTASNSFIEEWTELLGTTTPLPDHVARVSAAADGRVVSVFTDAEGKPIVEGQRVEKGTVLAQLDTTVTQANLASAEAARDVLREEERQAQLALDVAANEDRRLRKLKDDESAHGGGGSVLVSPVDVYKAGMALKDAESKLKGAQARLAKGIKDEDTLRAQLKLLTLTAPIAGRVGRLQVVPGQSLALGTTVAEIVDLDDQIDALCFVPPSMMKRLKLGQEARFGANLDSPEAMGQVQYIAAQAEPETGNFAVKVRFDNKTAHLAANRVLRFNIQTEEGRECLSLPESAVSEDQEVPTVVIVEDVKVEKNDEGKEETIGTARRLQVKLGVRSRTLHQVEILSLEDPDKEAKVKWQGNPKEQQYVVEGALGLQTGDKLKLDAGDD
jgi:RND family efflux transporter MFP subunit